MPTDSACQVLRIFSIERILCKPNLEIGIYSFGLTSNPQYQDHPRAETQRPHLIPRAQSRTFIYPTGTGAAARSLPRIPWIPHAQKNPQRPGYFYLAVQI